MKIKYNINNLKWATTIFFLLGNLFLIRYKVTVDRTFFIWFLPLTNCLAIISFIILSIFPRRYYVFDEKGCSFHNKNGKVYYCLYWEDVIKISYGYWGFISNGVEIEIKEHCNIVKYTLAISNKQAKKVYYAIPKVKEIVDAQIHIKDN